MKKKVRFLGLDVHVETIAVAIAEADGEVRSLGTIANRAESIRKLVKKLGPVQQLKGKRQTKLMFGCGCAQASGVVRIDERYGAFQCPDGHARSSPVARRAESADGWIEPGPVFAR
jgi:hypothetical protein